MTTKFLCRDGPYHGRRCAYPEPLPDIIVFADKRLRYHEYRRIDAPLRQKGRRLPVKPLYRWQRTYRIPQRSPREDT